MDDPDRADDPDRSPAAKPKAPARWGANRLLRMAEELAEFGHWWVDLETGTTGWSAEVFRIYGIDESEGVPPVEEGLSYYIDEDRPKVAALVTAAIEGQEPFSFSARLRRRDGAIRYVKSRGRPEIGEEGRVVALFGVIQDVTDRHLADLELRKLAEISNRTRNGVILADADKRIEWVNPAFTTITGYTAEEVLGKKPGSLLQGPNSDPQTIELMRQAVARGDGFDAEIVNYRKDGQEYWVAIEVKPLLNQQGQVEHYMAIETDITEQKLAHQRLMEAREEAQHASEVKSQFLANMSHEIRTPLHGILGTASLLRESDLPPKQLAYAQTIVESGSALLTVLNDILDHSKFESSAFRLEARPLSIAAVVKEVEHLFGNAAQAKNLSLESTIDLGQDNFVGDATRLRQILSNLVGNAIKFTHSGQIRVDVCERSDEEGPRIEISVSDTGIGFDDTLGKRLFRPFTQADQSPTRQAGGTGLGLAICKQLVEHMGGEISATSAPGKGSRFSFHLRLPRNQSTRAPCICNDPAAQAKRRPGIRGKPGKNRRVLLADDNPINRMVAMRMLESLGFCVDTVDNGLDAVHAEEQVAYDVVFLDIQMPALDGVEVARRIIGRDRSVGATTPQLVAMTANAFASDRERYRAAGMAHYIAKPFVLNDLQRLAQQL